YGVGFTGGSNLGAQGTYGIPSTSSGSTATISVNLQAPSSAGTYQANYRLKNASGSYFGDTFWVIVVVDSSSGGGNTGGGNTGSSCSSDNASFYGDANYSDNTHVSAGQSFTKSWYLYNNGTCTWGSGYGV